MENEIRAELEKHNETAISVSQMIQLAIDKGADLDKLQKLLDIKIQYEKDEARKSFNRSMVETQKNIEAVLKTRTNKQTNSKYADLENIIVQTKPVYTNGGFSINFHEGDTQKENNVRILADVIHADGYKEQYHYDVPLDGVGIKGNANMTAIHGKASSVSYGRRYLMCMIWNIPTGDDNDGNAQPEELITEKQLHELRDLLISKGIEKKEAKMCGILKVETLESLSAKDYQKAVDLIKAAKGAK